MIAKSDIIILFISSSALTLGLFNHYELQGPANPENRTSLVASTIGNIQKGGEAFADNAAQAWQFALAKITGDSSDQSSDADVALADKPELPATIAPRKIQPFPTQKSQPQASAQVPALSQASDSIPASTLPVTLTGEPDGFVKAFDASPYPAVTRIPGNATVLVISPSGNSRSDARSENKAQINHRNVAQTNTDINNNHGNQSKFAINPANKSVTATTAVENDDSTTVLSQEETANLVEIAAERQATESRAEQLQTQQLIKIHQVQRGETLTKIAETLGTTVARLKEMNQLPDDRILAGQDLIYETSVFTSARLATDVN